jgi:hypothetical protein
LSINGETIEGNLIPLSKIKTQNDVLVLLG